ncbi:MAG: DUF1588 domain-containing protein [Myxococcota bacterium]
MSRACVVRFVAPAVFGFIGGCQGTLDSPAGSEGIELSSNDGDADAADDDAPIQTLDSQLRRLTEPQYINTLREAFGSSLDGVAMPSFDDDIPTIGLANDPSTLRVSEVTLSSLMDDTREVARAVIENHSEMTACVDENSDACFESLMRRFGATLWRRPLNDNEFAELQSAGLSLEADRSVQAELVLTALMLSPNMLFRAEIGESGTISEYAIASALSYSLWDGPPDSILMDLAAGDQLQDPSVRAEQARRMVGDPRFAEAMTRFFWDYLKLGKLETKKKADEVEVTPAIRTALMGSARRYLLDKLSTPGATLFDVFQGQEFPLNALSAPYFGVEDAVGDDFQVRSVGSTERQGILSHPAFLSVHAGEVSSGIVQRGVYTLEQLLCQHLGAPPDDISEVEELPPGFDPAEVTSREALHVQHSSQPACAACHQFIDPAGYGYENYDTMGRYRTVEKGDIAIDASGSLALEGETLSFVDSVDYIAALSESEAMKSCVVKSFMTYVLGQEPGDAEMRAVKGAAESASYRIGELAVLLVNTPSFSERAPFAEAD